MHVLDHVPAAGKVVGEVAALSTIAATIFDKLPIIAAGVAIVWHVLLIYDWASCRFKRGRRQTDHKKKRGHKQE